MTALGMRAWATGVLRSAGFNSTIFEEFQDILGDLFGVEDVFGGGAARGGQAVRRAARADSAARICATTWP